jgi:hypothetical protein
MPFPLQVYIDPSEEELQGVFRHVNSAVVLRYATQAAGVGAESYHWTLRPPYDVSKLDAKTRYNIRLGIKKTNIRQVSFRELRERGIEALTDTYRRHGGAGSVSGLDPILDDCPAYEGWAAFIEDELAAYVVVLMMDDWADLIITNSTNRHLKFRPVNALLYRVSENLFARESVQRIHNGLEAGPRAKDTLEQFKARMGFVQEPVRQAVSLRPPLPLMINRYTAPLAVHLLNSLKLGRAARIVKMTSRI